LLGHENETVESVEPNFIVLDKRYLLVHRFLD